MTLSTCRLCGLSLLPEYEAILGAVIVGIEAAAYVSLAICTFALTLEVLGRTLRWLVR